MPNSVDIEEYIKIDEISQFLANDDIAKKNFFGNPHPVPYLPILINLARRAVEFNYTHTNYSQGLQNSANWMYSLCQPYAQKALMLLNNVTGIVITPSLPNQNYFVQQRQFADFLVGAIGSPMANNATILTITDADIAPETDDAEVEVHIDGLQEGQNFTGRANYTSVYAPNTYTITFDPPVQGDGQPATSNLISVKYPVKRNLTYSPTGGNTNYTAMLNGAETKTLVDGNGKIFPIANNTTGILRFNLFCISTANDIYVMTWEGSANNINNTITIYEINRTDINQSIILTVSVSADNINGGVSVQVTGIAGKTINCKATFTYDSTPF